MNFQQVQIGFQKVPDLTLVLCLDMIPHALVESPLEISELLMLFAVHFPTGILSHLLDRIFHISVINLQFVDVML